MNNERIAELEAKNARISARLDVVNGALQKVLDQRTRLEGENDKMRHTLERVRNVLANMAAENEGAVFNRWPIHHEPLRADARGLLPVIDEALAMRAEQASALSD